MAEIWAEEAFRCTYTAGCMRFLRARDLSTSHIVGFDLWLITQKVKMLSTCGFQKLKIDLIGVILIPKPFLYDLKWPRYGLKKLFDVHIQQAV